MGRQENGKAWLGLMLLLASSVGQAAEPLPSSLQGWQAWVLEGEGARQCALKSNATGQALNDYECWAATDLVLSPEGQGVGFSVRVKTQNPISVALPGQEQQWPQAIQVDRQPATLRRVGDSWHVVVPAGEHLIQGRWAAPFDRMAIPSSFPRVVWGPDNRLLPQEDGQAWLKAKAPVPTENEQPQDGAPKIQVWRRLDDGQALGLTTQVRLQLTGPAQRLTLGPALPAGFRAISWNSSTPAVLTQDGMLVIQAGRGNHLVTIEARCDQACVPSSQGQVPAGALALRPAQVPWPATETWSVVADPAFRQLSLDGQGVDPAAADVPNAWQSVPAFRVSEKAPLGLKVSSRGRQPGEGEQLFLSRETWLGDGQWLNWDQIQGRLPVGGRLAMQKPYALGRVQTVNNQPLPLSVDGAGNLGLEWGEPMVWMWAQSTQPTGRVPISGWNATLEKMDVTMHLPPGTALLAAPGTAPGNNAWIDRFTLLSFFGIALLALLVRQALGNGAAVVAALVAAGWVGNGGALLLLWLLALATAFHLIAQAIPAGRLRQVTHTLRLGFWILLAVVWIPFAGDQARMALHPQLPSYSEPFQLGIYPAGIGAVGDGNANGSLDDSVYGNIGDSAAISEMAAPQIVAAPAPAVRAKTVLQGADTSNAVDGNDPLAGVGLAHVGLPLPTWHASGQGRTYHLSYPGPLRPMNTDNSYVGPGAAGMQRVWVAPAWALQLLRALGTLALAWLALRLLTRFSPGLLDQLPKAPARWAQRLGLALLVLPGIGGAQEPAAPSTPVSVSVSNTPNEQTLAELKRRLTQAPACAPTCASLVAADLEANGDTVVATYRISVEHATEWALPEAHGAQLAQVQVDGSPAWFSSESAVVLAPGQARVVARYRPVNAQVSIDFPAPPLELSERVEGWTTEGTAQSGTWSIRRGKTTQTKTPVDDLPPAVAVPGYARVTRTLTLGATAAVVTTVERLPGSNGALTLHLPAITGENVESDRVERQGEAWVVTLPAGTTTQTFASQITLPKSGEMLIQPLPASEGQETWHLVKGPAWTLTLAGVPESMPQEGEQRLTRQIFPLAGETLRAVAVRLPAAAGEQQRIDQVGLHTKAGPQGATHTLTFVVTAAQAGERTLGFPEGSEIVQIKRDDQRLSLPVAQGRLTIPLLRGSQTVSVEFRTPAGTTWLTTPRVDLGGPASSVTYKVGHKDKRWVLWTTGPGWGTAVLYWSQLLVLLGVAWGLTKIPGRLFPLPVAVLLVLGFSTFSGTVVWLGSLVAWQAWVGWRARRTQETLPKSFNLQQVALAIFTAVTVLASAGAIAFGLLGAEPDMMLRSPPGLSLMEWLVPQTPAGALEGPTVISLPIWVYQGLLFAWALWFAAWLLQAVKRALAAWLHLGYWHKTTVSQPPPMPQVPKS